MPVAGTPPFVIPHPVVARTSLGCAHPPERHELRRGMNCTTLGAALARTPTTTKVIETTSDGCTSRPSLGGHMQFLQQLVNGLTIGSLYALIAVGYTVVYGIVQLINFAHGEVFMIGAFGALATWSLLFKGTTAIWVLPIMILGAMLASVSVALLMERIAYRPLRNAPRLAPLITAIGISVILQEAVRLFYPEAKSSLSFPGIDIVTGPPIAIGGLDLRRSTIFIILALIVCAVGLWVFINRTKQGRAMLAVSQDPDTARLMGVNVDRTIAIAFALGALLAAVAGVAQGLHTRTVTFNMGFMASAISRARWPVASCSA